MDKALKGYSRSYNIGVIDEKDALVQLKNTRLAIGLIITRNERPEICRNTENHF